MASGSATRRKRAAEQARAKASQTRPAAPSVDRRLWVALAVAGAIAVAIVVAVVTAGGDTKNPATGATLPDAAASNDLVAGIPQQGVVLGQQDAPVTLVEFVDLQCPFCREFEVEALPKLVAERVKTGTLRIEVRGLSFIGPDSERGLRAIIAAGEQNHLFELKALLYANQGTENTGWLSQDLVEAAARSVPGLDVARLVDDMGSGAVSDQIEQHAAEAARRGIDSTPTILVGRTGGELRRVELASASDVTAIERAIAAAER
jgi:protein-disulfide isomerase